MTLSPASVSATRGRLGDSAPPARRASGASPAAGPANVTATPSPATRAQAAVWTAATTPPATCVTGMHSRQGRGWGVSTALDWDLGGTYDRLVGRA